MTIEGLLESVESYGFAVEINLASSLRSALENLLADPNIRQLRVAIRQPEAAHQVLARVSDLTKRVTDVRYENPNDVALLAYAFVLAEHHPSLALAAASAICQVPNLWWAAALATDIVDNRIGRNEASSETPIEGRFITDAVDRVFVTDPRWALSAMTHLLEFTVDAERRGETVVIRPGRAMAWTEAADSTRDVEPAAA